jgi:pyrroline-5-carboxylate reductase
VEHVASFFDGEPQIIRIMPNTPAKVGEAMTAICKNDNVTEENLQRALDIFNTVGKAEVIDESLMDCVIGVSGSSPAYTYMYIEALAQAACDEGMDEAKAKTFAAQAVLGAAKMALESPESLEQLRINVCSPNGTTIEAVDALMANGFMDKVKEGFKAAADRSREMTREKLEKQKVQEAKG